MIQLRSNIRRVAARIPPGDTPISASRLGHLLSDLDWRTTDLPDDAVLCVRRLRLPLQRSLTTPTTDPRLRGETQIRVAASLSALARSAARPAREAVPAGADAVLFRDLGELLACLARDWCSGAQTSCWWWRVLFPGPSLTETVSRVWCEETQVVPIALARLEAAGIAGRFLEKLSESEITALWENMAHAFALRDLAKTWIKSATPLPGSPAPWSQWCPPKTGLTANRERLLVVALLLERAPSVVRSAAFARNVFAWVNQPKPLAPSTTLSEQAGETSSRFSTLSPTPPKSEGQLRIPSKTGKPGSPSTLSSARNGTTGMLTTQELASTPTPNSSRFEPVLHPPSELSLDVIQPPFNRANTGPEVPPAPAYAPETATTNLADGETVLLPTGPLPDRIETAWGGIFYLVNVAQALGYYGDFITPAAQGLALPLWDFLELFGHRFAGPTFIEDPLASLLRQLSGRSPDEAPGAHFDPPSGLSMETWLVETEHRLRTRLETALGETSSDSLSALVFQHRAHICATATRVDVTYSLSEHPIELRLAGLDRDPGWIPAGGRMLAFHYE